jgi:SAM-dependent methyltransferase
MTADAASPRAFYDGLSRYYDRYWHTRFHEPALVALERLLLDRLPPGASVLDVCCGAGCLAAALVERGLAVVGLDVSPEMLRHAVQRAPMARFCAYDARRFALRRRFDVAICTFDSVNHLLSLEDLRDAFASIAGCLVPGGSFVFDVDLDEAYETLWGCESAIVDDDHVVIVRGGYDPGSRLGRADITLLQREGETWRREDLRVRERCHSRQEIAAALASAGLELCQWVPAADLGMGGDIGCGRVWVLALRRPAPDAAR